MIDVRKWLKVPYFFNRLDIIRLIIPHDFDGDEFVLLVHSRPNIREIVG